MGIDLSAEDLELICDALKTEWLDWNDKSSLIPDKKLVESKMQELDSLSIRLVAILAGGE